MVRKLINRLFPQPLRCNICADDVEINKMLLGKMAANLNESRVELILSDIQKAEFKVFSQFGDDGIIQFLINYLEIEEKSFIEFGVENYSESNTRFLLMNNNWRGLIMDASTSNVQYITNTGYYWQHELTAKPLFVTKENINAFISDNGYNGAVGLLSIDIDGNDYWIFKEIDVIKPIIVIVEYNAVFGSDKAWTIPYDEKFTRTEKHFSNLYWGSSILSLCDVAAEKGYIFIGTNSAGNNAYFVRKDKSKGLIPLAAREGYSVSRYRKAGQHQPEQVQRRREK